MLRSIGILVWAVFSSRLALKMVKMDSHNEGVIKRIHAERERERLDRIRNPSKYRLNCGQD